MRGNRSCPTLLHKQTEILHPELIQDRIAVEQSQANPTHAVVSNPSSSRWKSVRTLVNYGYRQSTGNYYQHILTCRSTLPLNSFHLQPSPSPQREVGVGELAQTRVVLLKQIT